MIRLISFSILLSLCLPTVFAAFFQTVGGGSAQNDAYYASFLGGDTAVTSEISSGAMPVRAAKTIKAEALNVPLESEMDCIQSERITCSEALFGEPLGEDSIQRNAGISCGVSTADQLCSPLDLPARM